MNEHYDHSNLIWYSLLTGENGFEKMDHVKSYVINKLLCANWPILGHFPVKSVKS